MAVREAELKQAEATLLRKSRAFEQRAVSEVEVIDARANRDKVAAAIEAAKADIESAQVNLDYTRITSPIDGWISRTLVDVGNLVESGGQTQLATVVRDDPVYVYFYIPEIDYLRAMVEGEHKDRTRSPEEVK